MPRKGLEPPQPCGYYYLNFASAKTEIDLDCSRFRESLIITSNLASIIDEFIVR